MASQETIAAIRTDLERGVTMQNIMVAYGVSRYLVRKIKKTMIVKEDKPEIDPTDERVLKLESQLIASQDAVRSCKQAYKAAQRENSVFEALVDEMRTVVMPIKPLPPVIKVRPDGNIIKEAVVMHLSDEHADSVIQPHQVGGLERYDLPIALRRAEIYVDTVIRFTQQTMSNYAFSDLYIFANGDHVSGEIHGATDHSFYRNSFRNALAVGQMHALMYRDLCAHFPRVHVIYLPGNHGRRSVKKDYHGAWNNWDYLVGETAKLHCTDIENIDFNIPDSYSACVEIEGHGFAIAHGETLFRGTVSSVRHGVGQH
jgi:hypothetical protein